MWSRELRKPLFLIFKGWSPEVTSKNLAGKPGNPCPRYISDKNFQDKPIGYVFSEKNQPNFAEKS